MAEQLSGILGKPLTAAGVRKTLDRARDRFADLLLGEIAHSLADPTPDQLEEELIDLNLLEHCRPALERAAGQLNFHRPARKKRPREPRMKRMKRIRKAERLGRI